MKILKTIILILASVFIFVLSGVKGFFQAGTDNVINFWVNNGSN